MGIVELVPFYTISAQMTCDDGCTDSPADAKANERFTSPGAGEIERSRQNEQPRNRHNRTHRSWVSHLVNTSRQQHVRVGKSRVQILSNRD